MSEGARGEGGVSTSSQAPPRVAVLRQHEPAQILGFRAGLPKLIGDRVERGEALIQDDEPLVGVEQA